MKTHIIGVAPKRMILNALLNASDLFPASKIAVEHTVVNLVVETYTPQALELFKTGFEKAKGRLVFIGAPGHPCFVDKSINTISIIKGGRLRGWAILSDYLRSFGFAVTEDENRFIIDVK